MYILVKQTITVSITVAAGAAVNNTNKKVIFKNCAPFTDCITEINNTQVDDAQKIDIVMPMYNLIEFCDAFSKTSGSLWQYYRDEPALNANDEIINFPANSNINASLNRKQQITGETGTTVMLCYMLWSFEEISLINQLKMIQKTYDNIR